MTGWSKSRWLHRVLFFPKDFTEQTATSYHSRLILDHISDLEVHLTEGLGRLIEHGQKRNFVQLATSIQD